MTFYIIFIFFYKCSLVCLAHTIKNNNNNKTKVPNVKILRESGEYLTWRRCWKSFRIYLGCGFSPAPSSHSAHRLYIVMTSQVLNHYITFIDTFIVQSYMILPIRTPFWINIPQCHPWPMLWSTNHSPMTSSVPWTFLFMFQWQSTNFRQAKVFEYDLY